MRYSAPRSSSRRHFCLSWGSAGSRMPSPMSWLEAPPMVKNRLPPIS